MRVAEYLAECRDTGIYLKCITDVNYSEMPMLGRHERPTAYNSTEVIRVPVRGATVVGTEGKKPFATANNVLTFASNLRDQAMAARGAGAVHSP